MIRDEMLTRSPAMIQRASRSIASLRLKILSSTRASRTSSSLGLCKKEKDCEADADADVGDVPSGLVLGRRHRRKLAVNGDHALKGALRFRAHHLRVHLRQYAAIHKKSSGMERHCQWI